MARLSPTALLRLALRVLIPLSAALTLYLYLFPIFSTCAFPLPPDQPDPATATTASANTARAAFVETAKIHAHSAARRAGNPGNATTVFVPSKPLAPFRLLALGDPQLEGDTSVPTDYLGVFPHLKSLFRHVTFQSEHSSLRQRIRHSAHDLVDVLLEDTFDALESVRKLIDHFGNDFYLAHIYRTVHWWTRPTHVSVLGDLVGSQWINDDEFYRRADRFWRRVFRGAERVPDDLAAYPADEYDLTGYLGGGAFNESTAWARRLINVAGNHDIGYAGDINDERAERFETAFGKVNYELRFELPLADESLADTLFDADRNSNRLVPELRIVVLNDMNLDTPAVSTKLQDETYSFINNVINTAAAVEFKGHYTVILTHIPLYKPEGICVDDPFFDFHEHDGSLKEQNQLSAPASKGFLEGILGMSGNANAAGRGQGRQGIILNGHDHEGCDTWHYINQSIADSDDREWEVKRWRQATASGLVGRDELPGVREVTVRSMMGAFGGNAGLLSVWFDETTWEWRAEYATCPLGTQHLWWVVHILDLIVIIGVLLLAVATVLSALGVNVDGAVEKSVARLCARLCTPRKKAVHHPATPVKGDDVVKGGGSG
jgi:hypothetical protein